MRLKNFEKGAFPIKLRSEEGGMTEKEFGLR